MNKSRKHIQPGKYKDSEVSNNKRKELFETRARNFETLFFAIENVLLPLLFCLIMFVIIEVKLYFLLPVLYFLVKWMIQVTE